MRACAASLAEQYNFGAASSRDTTVFGACRPGGAGGDEQTPAGSLGDAAVAEWAAAMKAQGITRVVSLLDDVELTAYATPLHEQYGRLFTRCAAEKAAREYVCARELHAPPVVNAHASAHVLHAATSARSDAAPGVAGCAGTTW